MVLLEGVAGIACKSHDQSVGSQLASGSKPRECTTGHILIIEDHAMVLSILQASLRRLYPNMELVCVKSAGAALQVLNRRWFRVFIDPDAAGVDDGVLVQEVARLGLADCCCLITTRPQRNTKQQLQGMECRTCISTRMPIDQFNEALALLALGITVPKTALRDTPVPRLSPRHVELLPLLQRGLQNKAIAYELGIAEGTVRNHLHSLMKRLGVRNRMQAVHEASKFGIA